VPVASAYRPHAVRGRFNSWLFHVLEEPFHKAFGERKQQLFADLSGTVVEIGPGNGANFRYYPPGIDLIAIEPNPHMHRRLHRSADRYRVSMQLQTVSGEGLEQQDDSVDAVVGTLVMCTIPDPRHALQEVLRVLKPGGQYFFIEHVAAEPGTALRKIQEWIHGPWCWLFEGCHTNRCTAELLKDSGFADLQLEYFQAGATPPPVALQVIGVATKAK
jgi:ubiquinone/menaquinone biosynthesis C-methylase UbiE